MESSDPIEARAIRMELAISTTAVPVSAYAVSKVFLRLPRSPATPTSSPAPARTAASPQSEAGLGTLRADSVAGSTAPTVIQSAPNPSATFLYNRSLPSGSNPWIRYQRHVTGKDYEAVWEMNAREIALDAQNNGFTVEAKWTGRNDKAWNSSPYNPNHEFYDPERVLNQAGRQLEHARATNSNGVRFAVSNEAARRHFLELFEGKFKSDVDSGFLSVWYIPGDGM